MTVPFCNLHTADDSEAVISALGISEQAIHTALSCALHERRKSSALHPVVDAGFRFWSELVAATRRELIGSDKGWQRSVVRRMEMVVNTIQGINLIITSGDRYTGLSDGLPKTKNAKGEATRSVVHSNPGMQDMFQTEALYSGQSELAPIDSTRTYIFLYYYDTGPKEIRCEISYPVGMVNQDGFARISAWSKRIILSPLPFDGADIFPDEDVSEEVSIPVQSK